MLLFVLAKNAFIESIRQPIHAVLICIGLLALLLNLNVAGYTLGEDDKLLIDLGLSTLFLTGLLMSAFTATSVLAKEIENKTVLTVVSKPVPRPLILVGKFLGVTSAIGIAYWLLSITFLLTVRHRVQSSVRAPDIFDPVVVTFGISAIFLTFMIAGLANYLYRWSFPATFAAVGAVLATVTLVIVSCVSRVWRLQSPLTDYDPQLVIGLILIFEAIVVLTGIAIATSTRLGQVATLLVCIGFFLAGLVGEYFASVTLAGWDWLQPIANVFPNLQFFWPADALTQGQPITLEYLGLVTCYTLLLVGSCLSAATILFQRRDVG